MYDVIVVGAGAAGLTAAIYLARAQKKVLILERETIGGQMAASPLIENYPGYEKIKGSELALKMYHQALKAGAVLRIETVHQVLTDRVITEDGVYQTKAIIIATGAQYRKLQLDEETNLIGRGIHFCAVCDGTFYQSKEVAVVGDGNSAVTNALYLADIGAQVYLICPEKKLNCEKILEKRLQATPQIEVLFEAKVVELKGTTELEKIVIIQKGNRIDLPVKALFEAIGMKAETEVAKNLLELDDNNYFLHQNTTTKYDNILVAGDCIQKDVHQITTAVNDGTIAAVAALKYLNEGR